MKNRPLEPPKNFYLTIRPSCHVVSLRLKLFIIGFFLWIANIGTVVFSSLAFSLVIYQIFPILSSTELLIALAAALYINEFYDLSKKILSKFSWGNEFFRINNLKI